MPISDELIKIVVCPKCKGKLVYKKEGEWFDCPSCKLRYLVEDDIVNFVIESAKEIEKDD